jgi:hypothetical protein
VKTIGIERIHVEQDAGKLMHDQHPTMSYVDLNRSGVALMEIVSRPICARLPKRGLSLEAADDSALCRLVRRQHGPEGSMRADVNVSVRKPGEEFGTRTETKNVNSVRFVMQCDRAGGEPAGRCDRGWRQDGAGNPAVRSRHRHAPARCAPKKTRTIIAISPIPICCRWNWTTRSWKNAAPAARTAGRQAPPL